MWYLSIPRWARERENLSVCVTPPDWATCVYCVSVYVSEREREKEGRSRQAGKGSQGERDGAREGEEASGDPRLRIVFFSFFLVARARPG